MVKCLYDSHLTYPHISTCSHSHTLESGEVELMRAPNHLTLSLHCPTEPVEFSLFELPAAECRIEMKRALFSVWDSLSATTSKLTGRDCLQCYCVAGLTDRMQVLCALHLALCGTVPEDQCPNLSGTECQKELSAAQKQTAPEQPVFAGTWLHFWQEHIRTGG